MLNAIFQYKGKVYSFSTLDSIPMDIEKILKAIDEGLGVSLPWPTDDGVLLPWNPPSERKHLASN